MLNRYAGALFFVMVIVLVVGCAGQQVATQGGGPEFRAVDMNPKIDSGQYMQKVSNFLVILDASGTMRDSYKEQTKLDLAKDFVSGMNQTIPDLDLIGGLRAFGHGFSDSTDLVYGRTKYSKAPLEEALGKTTGGGMSPLGGAINAATGDLAQAQGNMAVIIVSDGLETDLAGLQAAQSMKAQFEERVCIYTVLVGDDQTGRSLLEQIARIGECGFSVDADSVGSSADMADFVEKVFLARTGAKDSDGDGVVDDLDRCPNTPPRVEVDANGCPLDTDGDGVYDYLDRCPGTPEGAKVDMRGCWVLEGVRFDTDRSDIKAAYYLILDEAVAVLKKNPSLKIEIQGHTDSVGNTEYNRALSERRANSVMEYFVDKGIERERLSTIGYGVTQPIASNLTPEGRAKNRRVELNPTY